jgi:hypothetical protein
MQGLARFWLPALCLLVGAPASAVIDPGSATSVWTAIAYPNLRPDWADDQQTGITEADIVGDAAHPAFYMRFDDNGNADPSDDQLAFRVRLGADKNPPGFEHFFGVGLDADLDGALDIFLAVDNTGSNDRIGIFAAGTGANTSPSTTSIVSTPLVSYSELISNYHFSAVNAALDPTATTFDFDADGDTDFFLSFVIDFEDVVNVLGIPGFGPSSAVRFVAGSSTQPNALNQDLGGPNGGTNSSLTWEQLGAVSSTYSVAGLLLDAPEPGSAVLLGLGLVALGGRARRKPSPR